MKKIKEPHVDRSHFSIVPLSSASEDTRYWVNQSLAERLAAVKQARQILYGYDPSTIRLQRILEVAELKPG